MDNTPCVAFYGKIRIPTIGHKKAISEAKVFADSNGYAFHIGVSGRADPLTKDQKKYFSEAFFGQPIEDSRDIISFLTKLSEQHSALHLFAGSDRAKEYRTLISKYNGKPDKSGKVLFEFRTWKVHPIGKRRDIDKPIDQMTFDEKLASVSATKLEQLVESNDYHSFKQYHPNIPETYVRKLYGTIRSNLKEEVGLPAIGQTLSRDLMPQITGDSLPDFLKFLKKKNIEFHKEKVDPGTLKSTQSEFDTLKVTSLMYNQSSDPIITSNDDHVLDGHHRWLADFNTGRHSIAYKVDLPVLELYRVAKEYCSKLNESLDHKKFSPMVDSFVSFASEKLGIKSLPNVNLSSDSDLSSFGGYAPSNQSINIVTKNRHPMDIFRTLAHELVHHKQNEDGRIKDVAKEGSTGSPIEDEANSMAGRLMRWYAKANPDHFKLGGLAEATFVVGVPCSGKDVVIKNLLNEDTQEIDIMALFKANFLSESVIISSSAEDVKIISLAKKLLEENGYDTKLIFVDIENGISKLRNEQRELRGQKVLNESIRFTKYNKAKENMKTLKELFGNKMSIVENEQLDEKKTYQRTARGLDKNAKGFDVGLKQLINRQKKKKLQSLPSGAQETNILVQSGAKKMEYAMKTAKRYANPPGDPVRMVKQMTTKASGEKQPIRLKKKRVVFTKPTPVPDFDQNRRDDLAAIERIKQSKADYEKRKNQAPKAPETFADHMERYHKTGNFDYKAAVNAIHADHKRRKGTQHEFLYDKNADLKKAKETRRASQGKTDGPIRRLINKVSKSVKDNLEVRRKDRVETQSRKKDLRFAHGPVKGTIKGIMKYGLGEAKMSDMEKANRVLDTEAKKKWENDILDTAKLMSSKMSSTKSTPRSDTDVKVRLQLLKALKPQPRQPTQPVRKAKYLPPHIKEEENTPSQREWGKKSLTKIYAGDTPGEDKKIEEGNPVPTADGPGPEYEVGRSPLNPFGTSIHESVKEWAEKPETIERYKKRYGDKAQTKLNETVKALSNMTSIPRTTKTVTSIRENWDSLSGSDMGSVANASSKETTDDPNGKMVVKKLRRKNNK